MSRIDEIKKRVEAATEGPWWSDEMIYVFQGENKKCKSMVCDFDESEAYLARMRGVGAGRTHEQQLKDMAFIAHSRNDIPWLLGIIDTMEEIFKRVYSCTDCPQCHDTIAEVLRMLHRNKTPPANQQEPATNSGGEV